MLQKETTKKPPGDRVKGNRPGLGIVSLKCPNQLCFMNSCFLFSGLHCGLSVKSEKEMEVVQTPLNSLPVPTVLESRVLT